MDSARTLRDAAMTKIDEYLAAAAEYRNLCVFTRADAVALLVRVAGGLPVATTIPIPGERPPTAAAVAFRETEGQTCLAIATHWEVPRPLRDVFVVGPPEGGAYRAVDFPQVKFETDGRYWPFSDPELDALQEFPADDMIGA